MANEDSGDIKINFWTIVYAMLAIAVLLSAYNSVRLLQMGGPADTVTAAEGRAATLLEGVAPEGIPDPYGRELEVSYDDISPTDPQRANAAIARLGQLDNAIQLTPEQNERYVNILYLNKNGISCEYCCGARAVIFETGEPACGCAHSYAMRGLAKYLITKHGDEFTDDEILAEVAKWKILFFPTQMQEKAAVLKEQGIELNYINLASNAYRGIEQGSGAGGMVGGC